MAKHRISAQKWLENFDTYLRRRGHVRRALKSLTDKGCDELVLLELVANCYPVNEERFRRTIDRWYPTPKRLNRIARTLDWAAGEIRELNSSPFWPSPQGLYWLVEEEKRNPSNPPLEGELICELARSPQRSTQLKQISEEFESLPTKLEGYATTLRSLGPLAKQFRHWMSYRNVGKRIRIAVLLHYVHAKTGAYKYSKVADLLEASYWAHTKKNKAVYPETVKKRHKRFLQSWIGRGVIELGILDDLIPQLPAAPTTRRDTT